MQQYNQLKKTINNLITESQTLPSLVNSVVSATANVDLVKEELDKIGNSKLSSKYGKVTKMLYAIQKELISKKLRKISDIKNRVKEVQNLVLELNPDTYKSNQAIEDTFTPSGIEPLKISLPKNQLMSIDRAPMMLMSTLPIRGKALKLLQSLNAIIYKGTNGILLPDVPVLIINLNIIDRSVIKSAVKEILKEIKPKNTPVPLHSLSKVVGNLEVIPCFKKEYVVAIDELFTKISSKKLLVEEK